MKDEYLIKCKDAQTGRFVGYLRPGGYTRTQKSGAARFDASKVDREVKAINAYGKYIAEKVVAP